MDAINTSLLDWGLAEATLAGQAESGDRHLVMPTANGMLVAVVDGLGHGDDAAVAAKTALNILRNAASESVISVLKRCHQGLLGTRGVVMSMASFNAREGTMTWLGVGNVEGLLLRSDPEGKPVYESLLLRRGVVGGRLPPLSASILPVSRGDTLILVTDGIRSGFERGLNPNDLPQHIADRILAQHGLGKDDALVFVGRYLGNTP